MAITQKNCHAECIASGTVPLFHKHFCDNVIHPVQGKPISQCQNSGTLGVDHTNFNECRDQMVKLKNDPAMRDDWREMAFEFWKQHSDGEMVVERNSRSRFKHYQHPTTRTRGILRMKIFITGQAGMIGFHSAKYYAEKGHAVVGVDNFNDYYDVELKRERARILREDYRS